jgi:hypothetical protein
MLHAIWIILTLPFRVIAGTFALIGRTVLVTLGFLMMVGGVFASASAIYILGVPMFVVGLLATLRGLS